MPERQGETLHASCHCPTVTHSPLETSQIYYWQVNFWSAAHSQDNMLQFCIKLPINSKRCTMESTDLKANAALALRLAWKMDPEVFIYRFGGGLQHSSHE